MKTFKANLLTIAVLSAISLNVQADTDANTTAEKDVEVISVLGKRVSYANNTTDESMKLAKAPIGNVMDLIDSLPGINVGQGDAFGSDDYTTTISMRGFVIDRADQQ